MTELELWKVEISSRKLVDINNDPNERIIRKAMSELTKEGVLFVPVASHTYIKVGKETPLDLIEKALHANFEHLKTQYRNKIKPFRQYVTEEKMKAMMGELPFEVEA